MIESFTLKGSMRSVAAQVAEMVFNQPAGPEISTEIANAGYPECRLKECALDGFCVNQLNGALIAQTRMSALKTKKKKPEK
jgi:hypothetical protein